MKTLKMMFVAGSLAVLAVLAVLACPGWAATTPGAVKMNTLPTYMLPASAAADGKLAEWAGNPASPKKKDPRLRRVFFNHGSGGTIVARQEDNCCSRWMKSSFRTHKDAIRRNGE